MRFMLHRASVLLLLTVAGPVAWAGVGDAVPFGGGNASGLPAKVQAQVAQGQAALSQKRFSEARQAFGAAFRQVPRAGLLLALARVAVGEGRTLDSIDLYRRYLADPTREPDEAATKEAEQAVLAEPPDAGSVNVQGDSGMLVTVDGLLRGSVPLAQPVLLSPGKHTVTMELGGSKREQVLTVQHGRLLELRTNQRAGSVLISKLPALLTLSDWGKVPAEALRPLREAQEKAARQQTMALMPPAAALANLPTAKDCVTTTPCQQQLLQKNELEYALRSQVEYQPSAGGPSGPRGGDYRIKLSLLHVELQESASEQEQTCVACTADQVATQYLGALSKLLTDGLNRKHAVLSLRSEPPAAQVYLGRALLGSTPLTQPLWAGQYDLTLKRPGYEDLTHAVVIGDDAAAAVLTLKELPEPRPPLIVTTRIVHEPRPRWRLAVGGVAVGLGVGLMGLGGAFVPSNGTCQNPGFIDQISTETDTSPLCLYKYKYNLTNAGYALISLGAVSLVAGVITLSIPGKRKLIREEK